MKKKRPNVLLITSDQQHYDTIGAFNKEIKTPNLDRLVKEGTAFNRAYTVNPTCTPSRATLITGKYPSQHGAWTLGTKLKETEWTIGDELQKNDYRTSLIGKAHFQPLKSTEKYSSLEAYPILQDLEYWKNFNENFYGFENIQLTRNHTNEPHVGQHYALWLEEKGCKNWRDYFLPGTGNMSSEKEHKWDIPEEFHYDTWIAEKTNNLLEKHKEEDENFFIWASFFDPHPPYLVSEPWASMYNPNELTIPCVCVGEHKDSPPHIQMTQEENPDFSEYRETGFPIHGMSRSHLVPKEKLKKDIATYYGMISMMDKYIGKILDKLDSLGLTENTIVIFTTDHGHYYGHHGLTRKGAFMYEDLIKIPFLVRWPNKVLEDKLNSSMQSLVDVVPTILAAAEIEVPREITGKNQLDVWCGKEKSIRNHIICENHHEPTTINQRTYVDERYKITVYYNEEYGELYDLEKDPKELKNLWNKKEYEELKNKLLLKYIWAELEKEPMWMPRIAGA